MIGGIPYSSALEGDSARTNLIGAVRSAEVYEFGKCIQNITKSDTLKS
jgi:hypothetical protein